MLQTGLARHVNSKNINDSRSAVRYVARDDNVRGFDGDVDVEDGTCASGDGADADETYVRATS